MHNLQNKRIIPVALIRMGVRVFVWMCARWIVSKCSDLLRTRNVINDCRFRTIETFESASNSQKQRDHSQCTHFAYNYLLCVFFHSNLFESSFLSIFFSLLLLQISFHSICHCQWNRKCRSLWHSLITNTKYKMWFYANGWKVFKDHHGVWLDFLSENTFRSDLSQVLFSHRHTHTHSTQNPNITQSLVPHLLLLSFFSAYACSLRRFRIHIRCIVCLPIECIAYRAKTHLNSEHRQMWKSLN